MHKRILSIILLCEFIFCSHCIKCIAENEIDVSALSAIVICADNNQIIFSKNAHQKLPMASTTKIMTSLLALEKASSEDFCVTITDKMVPVEGSSMNLKVGDILPLTSLAKGMLTLSGNDAANSVAIALGGSLELFSDMMNEKALQIGMKETHFVTPSGLDDDEHYSTAYDMALLGSYALENEAFYNISSNKKVDVPFIEPNGTLVFYNENRMLQRYDGCIGIKTGFTKKAGRCLVSAAERNGVRLIAVTLNAPDDWNDHEKMLDFGFSQIESITFENKDLYRLPIVGSNEDKIIVSEKEPVKVITNRNKKEKIKKIIEIPQFVYAPIKKGDIIGKIQYTLDGKVLATSSLIAEKDIPFSNENIFKKCSNFFKRLLKNMEK